MQDFQTFVEAAKAHPGNMAGRDGVAPGRRPSRREFLRACLGIGLLAGSGAISGCAFSEAPGLSIATNPWIGYELLYLGRDLAASEAQAGGSRVRLVELISNTDSMQALAAGTVDGAGLTLDEVISAHAAGLDLKIVLVFDYSAGADVLLARPGIDRLGALKGRRIGVEQSGVGALMLDAALKQAGLAAQDIRLVNLTADQHLSAFGRDEVDAVVTFEPIAGQIAAAGGRRLFDSRAIPGSIVDVLAIRAATLAANPDAARMLVAQYFNALAYLRRHPGDAHRRMAPRLGLSAEAMRDGYQFLELPDLAENRRLLRGSPSPLAASAAGLAALMLEKELIARPVDVADFVVDTCLPEAQQA